MSASGSRRIPILLGNEGGSVRLLMRSLLVALPVAFANGCNDTAPQVKTKMLLVQEGQDIDVDSVGADQRPHLSITEDGRLFVRSETFPGRSDMSDVSGISRIYIFVPERHWVAARRKKVTITGAEGLQAFEYSRNDAFPEDYCLQRLSVGPVSLSAVDGANVVIESRLAPPPITFPTDAKCDSPGFAGTMNFPNQR